MDNQSRSFWRIWYDNSEKQWVGRRVTEYEDGVNHAGYLCFFGNEHPDTGEEYTCSADVSTKGYA